MAAAVGVFTWATAAPARRIQQLSRAAPWSPPPPHPRPPYTPYALPAHTASPPLQVRAIADLELAKTAERVRERGIALEVSTALMQRIVAEGYNEAMGARELRRAVVHLVDDPLSDALLRGEVGHFGEGGGGGGARGRFRFAPPPPCVLPPGHS